MTPAAKILIVDDEPGIRFYLAETLTRDGHQVVAAESGQAALNCLAARDFDLVLLDLKLKDMNGLDVLAALRRQSPETIVIMLTAHASLETAVEALRQGAHDYLFKPCKTVELRESVRTGLLKRQRELEQRALLAELEKRLTSGSPDVPRPALDSQPAAPLPEQEPGRFLRRGELIVDFMRHVILLDGHLLELSPTEFDLLAYLASVAPRVAPPQELVREVQGYDCDPREASDLLRYHIYRLRRKIQDATGHADLIRTRRGVGYALSE
jgi:DNA-binding response OmpR family regulator